MSAGIDYGMGTTNGDRYVLTRQEAIARLTKRYNEQAELTPRLRDFVPLELYIKRNIRAVRVFGSLGP